MRLLKSTRTTVRSFIQLLPLLLQLVHSESMPSGREWDGHVQSMSNGNDNCKFYNETIPSRCWGHGCQFHQGSGRCTVGTISCEAKAYKKCICSQSSCPNLETEPCSPDPPIFKNKLSCRRANTYYVYHPKSHCFSEADSGDCTATVVYAVNLHGGATKDQRGIRYIADDNSGFRDPHQTRRLINECKNGIAGVTHQKTSDLYARSLVGTKIHHPPKGSCIYYPIPLFQNGEYMLTIKMTEGNFHMPDAKCTEVRINDVPIMIHMDTFTLSGMKKCGVADVVLMFLAEDGDENHPESDYTLYLKGHDEPIQVKGGQMDLQFCFGYDCRRDSNFEVSAFTLERLGAATKKLCRDCKYYNGTVPSQCWGHGCQYYRKQGEEGCATGTISCEVKTYETCICSQGSCGNLENRTCSPDPPIFENKLSCRRTNSYYVYHPKTLCYSEKDSGDCTATATYAVNLNGGETTDQRGIRYIADDNSGFRDPFHARRLTKECDAITGISHQNTVDLYARVMVLKQPNKRGRCIYYPVPICQNGEYMLTIKMTEGLYGRPERKCSEARINDVPIMIHMDAFTLSGKKKCGVADVVLMFLAEGGDEANPESKYTLHLKGHDEPIQVTSGEMDLQFCFGYDCVYDDNAEASAFTLERVGTGTKECKRKSK